MPILIPSRKGEPVAFATDEQPRAGTTTVMVTHDNRIAEQADRVITLEDGRIVADTAPPT